ncbi:hypothetical protein BK127_37055 [Paenibacillus sp. FSL H7-0331]|nr:hypothetical protein BK127_37055 [Paenibacillus sp. FSL H7-0331]
MRWTNIILKLISHLLLLVSIGFAIFLYSDDYEVFPWATRDEALKYLHLILTIPIPLLGSLIINMFITRGNNGLSTRILRYFPIGCLFLISGFFFLITSLNTVMLQLGFGIAIVLFIIEIYLLIYDLKQ